MARFKASQRWLEKYSDDPYVEAAQRDGHRSCISYKLLEIQEKGRILHPDMTVIDLGAAPGGWSQVTSRVIGDRGRLITLGILEMDSVPDVAFIQGDFAEDAVSARILEMIGDRSADPVISDMAPSMGGVWAAGRPRAVYLCELALDPAGRMLWPDGDFLIKIFQGKSFDQYHKQARKMSDKVQTRKPLSSHDCSREQYLFARGSRGEQTEVVGPTARLSVDDLLRRDGQGFIEGYGQCLCVRALV